MLNDLTYPIKVKGYAGFILDHFLISYLSIGPASMRENALLKLPGTRYSDGTGTAIDLSRTYLGDRGNEEQQTNNVATSSSSSNANGHDFGEKCA